MQIFISIFGFSCKSLPQTRQGVLKNERKADKLSANSEEVSKSFPKKGLAQSMKRSGNAERHHPKKKV
jgi:hypothetical protein